MKNPIQIQVIPSGRHLLKGNIYWYPWGGAISASRRGCWIKVLREYDQCIGEPPIRQVVFKIIINPRSRKQGFGVLPKDAFVEGFKYGDRPLATLVDRAFSKYNGTLSKRRTQMMWEGVR